MFPAMLIFKMMESLTGFELVLKIITKTDADFFSFLILQTFTTGYTACYQQTMIFVVA